MSKKYWLFLAGLALLVPAGQAYGFQEKESDKTEQKKEEADQDQDLSPIEKVKKLEKEVRQARAKFTKVLAKAQKDGLTGQELRDKVDGVYGEFRTLSAKIPAKVLKIVRKNPTADGMKKFVLKKLSTDRTGQFARIVLEHYSEGDTLLPFATQSALSPSRGAGRILKQITESEASDKVKSIAKYGIAAAKMASFRSDDLEKVDELANNLKSELEAISSSVPESFVKKAKGKINAFQNVRVGKVAPDIAGLDMDGTSFRLSDYRGKVVMLDFWGDW